MSKRSHKNRPNPPQAVNPPTTGTPSTQPQATTDPDQWLHDHRDSLQEAQGEAIDSYDKTILTLAAGAIAISITVVKDLIGPTTVKQAGLLYTAWFLWVLSVCGTLISFLTSWFAGECGVNYCDAYEKSDRKQKFDIFNSRGGWMNRWTHILNISAGLLFIGGLLFMLDFLYVNLNKAPKGNTDKGTNDVIYLRTNAPNGAASNSSTSASNAPKAIPTTTEGATANTNSPARSATNSAPR